MKNRKYNVNLQKTKPMLSILIPVYNYNIVKLVTELHKQATETLMNFEIIVLEDGSTRFLEENKVIKKLDNCIYEINNINLGRSAIRNRLADKAKYEHLLFLDCDAEVYSLHFISKYEAFCREECVVLGGRMYDEKDYTKEKSLILTYGLKRERYDVPKKNDSRHKMFMTPNFLISKSIFNKIRFDENIKGYGHEDSVFGIQLQRLGIDFLLIDNPVIHKGLEDNITYIKKNELALEKLFNLYISGLYPELGEKSKVLKMYLNLNKLHLNAVIRFKFKLLKPTLIKNITGLKPNLILFDLYKLGYLTVFASKK